MSIQNIWGKLATLNSQGILDTLVGMGGVPTYVAPSGYATPGNDNNSGSFDSPMLTLKAAYAQLRTGRHDFIVVLNDPTSTALTTLRLDAAFDWNKANTHLIGACAPMLFGQRARIAPTSTTTAFANFFTISANGCIFQNIEWYHGFATGTTSMICMTVTGQHNWFKNCQITGMMDTASAQNTASRSLLVENDENLFEDCVIGADTVQRTVANASLELAANPTSGLGAARNVFRNCFFPIWASTTTILGVIISAASAIDRYTNFNNCTFECFGATLAGLATIAASAGGYLVFKDCMLVSISGYGTAAGSRAQEVITGPTDGSTHAGVGYAPSA